MSIEKSKNEVQVVEDKRIDFIRNQVIRTMRIKNDKWNKLMTSEELKVQLNLLMTVSYEHNYIFMVWVSDDRFRMAQRC